jgi:hypothetical protein
MVTTSLDVAAILIDAGVRNVRQRGHEIEASCPLHVKYTGKPDLHASWSINDITYLHNCFSCPAKGTLTSLLVELLGSAPEDVAAEVRRQDFLSRMSRVTRAKDVPDPEEIAQSPLTEWALEHQLDDVPSPLLKSRLLKRAAADAFGIRWDTLKKCWVLPVRSILGILMGAQYRQQGTVLTLPEGMAKSTTLFGLSAMKSNYCAALVESPLDAVRLFQIGLPAVSSMGAFVSNDQCKLLARNFTTVYVALDDDAAGRAATQQVLPRLRKAGCAAVPWIYGDDGAKDPGDVASDDLLVAAWERTRKLGL